MMIKMQSKRRILICWSHISGYMAACWKELAALSDVELRILAWLPNEQATFDTAIMSGLNFRLLNSNEKHDKTTVTKEIEQFQPDTVITTGWANSSYSAAILELRRNDIQVIMAMDTPWQGTVRQRLTRLRHRRFLSRVDHAIVASEKAWHYARRLGFPTDKISRGVYGWDERAFANITPSFKQPSFTFVGRLSPEKGISILIEAYQGYLDRSRNPWALNVCGIGPLQTLLEKSQIRYLGFVQPVDLPGILQQSSVLILPSQYEPWGVVVAEAMGAGLPVIATEACGAAIDLIRPRWNGQLIPSGNADALRDAMLWFEQNSAQLPELSRNARKAAAPYTSKEWGMRIANLVHDQTIRAAA